MACVWTKKTILSSVVSAELKKGWMIKLSRCLQETFHPLFASWEASLMVNKSTLHITNVIGKVWWYWMFKFRCVNTTSMPILASLAITFQAVGVKNCSRYQPYFPGQRKEKLGVKECLVLLRTFPFWVWWVRAIHSSRDVCDCHLSAPVPEDNHSDMDVCHST